jgi:hypothetical protein
MLIHTWRKPVTFSHVYRLLLCPVPLFLAAVASSGQSPSAGHPKETNAPPARGERYKDQLKTGMPAPDFALPLASGNGTVTLSSFRAKKPVILIFGSYT